eukprot:TRINITY_DN33946_c0_g1_i1.p1 TRINITY_DN33946_c0_g1~~TRINITY_DN33946_c0_g1_i1.p1  ORF type:complete len:536 (+),score=99.86 TRINITY_DN33946_c0_g1_i1:202-1809(+)
MAEVLKGQEAELLHECLADACLDGEASQITEALRCHLRFSSEVGRGAIREEVGAEVRRFADQLSDVEGLLSDYRKVYSSLVNEHDVDADTEAGSRRASKEKCKADNSPTIAPARTPKPPSDSPAQRIPEFRRFMPSRSYEGRGSPAGPVEMGKQSFGGPELSEWQGDMDLYGAWEVSFEMRQKLAEKLRHGVQQRRQRWWCEGEDELPERHVRHERTEEEEPCPHKHRSGPLPQPSEEESGDCSWYSPTGKYKWQQGSGTAYTFQGAGLKTSCGKDEDDSVPSPGCAGKPSTEYSFRYEGGEHRTAATVLPGARPSSRGPADTGPWPKRPTQPPTKPPAPAFESCKTSAGPSPRAARFFREDGTRPPSAGSSPKAPPPRPAGSSSRPPPPGFTGSASAQGENSFASASANAWSSNQKRWGTASWGKPGWGTSGWSRPSQQSQPSPTAPPPKPPPAAQPPAVAAALAGARTPSEQAAVTSLETRLQELRRLPKEEQRRRSKELMVRWHPDKNPGRGDESTRIFQWLQNRKKELLGL